MLSSSTATRLYTGSKTVPSCVEQRIVVTDQYYQMDHYSSPRLFTVERIGQMPPDPILVHISAVLRTSLAPSSVDRPKCSSLVSICKRSIMWAHVANVGQACAIKVVCYKRMRPVILPTRVVVQGLNYGSTKRPAAGFPLAGHDRWRPVFIVSYRHVKLVHRKID